MGIISADDMAAALHDATPPVVCDVRFYLGDLAQGRREYDAGHIPGARFVDAHVDLADHSVRGRGRHPLPTVHAFAVLLGRIGATPDTHVVAYDSASGAIAARLWWMLRSIGHDRVSVLDGGLAAWVASAHPTTTAVPIVEPSEYPPPTGWTGIVTADEVAAGLTNGTTVIDSRAPERYRGEVEPIDARAGHIPGAINRFHVDTIGDQVRFRDPTTLAERFADVGPQPIVYCGSGITACHNLLAMSLAGIDDARLYPGSWSEWSSDPARP